MSEHLLPFVRRRQTLLPPAIQEEAQRLVARIAEVDEGPIFMAVVHERADDVSVGALLHQAAALATESVYMVDETTVVGPQARGAVSEPRVLFIHNAPRLSQLAITLREAEQGGWRAVVSTGIRQEWAQVFDELPVPMEVHTLGGGRPGQATPGRLERARGGALREAREAARLALTVAGDDGLLGRILLATSLVHSAGLPMPLRVLEAVLSLDDGGGSVSPELVDHAVESLQGYLWLDLDGPQGDQLLMVRAATQLAAAEVWSKLYGPAGPAARDVGAGLVTAMLKALDPAEVRQRHWAAALLGALVRTNRGAMAHRALSRHAEVLAPWWPVLSSEESLAWAGIGCHIGLPALARSALGETGPRAGEASVAAAWARTLHVEARLDRTPERVITARDAFEKTLRLAPDDPYVLHLLARFEEELGEPIRAEQAFNRALLAAPRNLFVRASAASFFVRSGRGALADGILGHESARAAVRDPFSVSGVFLRHVEAERWRRDLSYRRAEEGFRWILGSAPDHLASLTSLGASAWGRGHLATARHWLARAREVHPESPLVLLLTAQTLRESNPAQWEELLLWVLDLDPGNLHARTALTAGFRRMGRDGYEQAAVHLDGARRIAPQNPYVLVEEAQLVWARKGVAGDGEFIDLLQLGRGFGAGHVATGLLAVHAWRMGDRPLAAQRFAQALETARGLDAIKVLNTWAGTVVEGDEGRAVDLVRRALALDPWNAHTLRACLGMGRPDDNEKESWAQALELVVEGLVCASPVPDPPQGFTVLERH